LNTRAAPWFNATKGFGFIQPDSGGPRCSKCDGSGRLKDE
jgi:hypothetical protein